jgi:hypothetical protein
MTTKKEHQTILLRFYDIVLNNSQQSVFYLTDGWLLMTPIYPNDLGILSV